MVEFGFGHTAADAGRGGLWAEEHFVSSDIVLMRRRRQTRPAGLPTKRTGKSHSFGGTYRELAPHERICYTDKFDDPNLPGEMLTTVTLRKVSRGTELTVVQEGVPAVIPAEACYLGWQESLVLLAKLVEAEIPDYTSRGQE